MKMKINSRITQHQTVRRMLENEGMAGFGTYMALLFELAKKPGRKCTPEQIREIGKSLKIDDKILCNVMYGYGLFNISEQENGEALVTSAYLLRTGIYTGNIPACPGADTGAYACACAKEEEEEEEEKGSMADGHTPATTPQTFTQTETPAWEKYIDLAAEDTGWLESVAMNNRLPVKNRLPEIIAIFKRHVRAQASEKHVDCVEEAKRYFANYARMGRPTYKSLMAELSRTGYGAGGQQNEPATCRNGASIRVGYEDVDPQTGERTYCGIPIPPKAPPRPNEYAVYVNDQWES